MFTGTDESWTLTACSLPSLILRTVIVRRLLGASLAMIQTRFPCTSVRKLLTERITSPAWRPALSAADVGTTLVIFKPRTPAGSTNDSSWIPRRGCAGTVGTDVGGNSLDGGSAPSVDGALNGSKGAVPLAEPVVAAAAV